MNKVVLAATWNFGRLAVEKAFNAMEQGASPTDALESGINAVELDESVQSVGYGGLPTRAGYVELDAAIMEAQGHRSGAVAALRGCCRAISVARRVMEVLPHALLVGEGAMEFAREQGFEYEETLSSEASETWLEWRDTQAPPADVHNDIHDTVGMIIWTPEALVVGCSTSGLKWKHPGRVGDSPIVGAGLYADEQVGAAVATGNGDEISRVALCSRVVFSMERGMDAEEACEEAIRYLVRKRSTNKTIPHAAVIAVRADGTWGASASYMAFPFALHDGVELHMVERKAIQ